MKRFVRSKNLKGGLALLSMMCLYFASLNLSRATDLVPIEEDEIERSSAVQSASTSKAVLVPRPTIQKTSERDTGAQIPTPQHKPIAKTSTAPKPAAKIQMASVKTDIPLPQKRPVLFKAAPPAFSSGLLSDSDRKHYRQAFKYLQKFKWQQALDAADKAQYKLPAKFIRWSWLRAYKGGASFENITSFMIDNPDWPYRETLMRRAEQALVNPISADQTISWFFDRSPLTGMGMLRYGEALLTKGQTQKGEEWIRKAWHEGSFSEGLERKLLKQHKSLLSQADHEKRLDRLLWDRDATDAIRMFDKVSTEQKKLAIARIRLMRMARNVDAGVRQVPKELYNDPGFVFDRVKWRRRKGRDEEARELLLKMGPDAPNPEIWWREREIQARQLLRKGHITQAYYLASENGLTTGAKFAAAEWLSGWIALRFLHENENALAHFTRLYNNVSYPISRARGAYWIGRAYTAMKDKQSAQYWYEEATKFSSTFYGQVAMNELGLNDAPELKKKSSFSSQVAKKMDNSEQVKIVKLLAELGQERYARPFLIKMTENSKDTQEYVYLGKLAQDINRPDYSVAVAKRASQLGTELPDISWPSHSFAPDRPAIEEPLIMAITRQESAFAIDARSRAGALGLMQLMPRTANSVSKKLKLKYSKQRLTTDPEYNILLGSHYLGGLIDGFDGSYILAIASYNAGRSRIKGWIRDWGDPRSPDINTLDWIELIPFSETRNYVQRVMENLQVYRQLMNNDEYRMVQIGADLSRGNPTN